MQLESEIPSVSKLRILIVDDRCDKDYHGLFKLLELRGHVYVCCKSVQEAVDCFQTHPFDIVLLDILFPDADPDESVRAVNKFNPAKVIVMTGSDEPSLRKACLARGAFDFLLKGQTEYTVYDAILKAASDDTSEPNELDRELIINRKMAEDQRNGWWTKWRNAFAIAASTITIMGVGATGAAGMFRYIYKSGGERQASDSEIVILKKAQEGETNARITGEKDLTQLINSLKSEFDHRKEVVDKSFAENDKADTESKKDREQINKRIDAWTADISSIRIEMSNNFRDLQNSQTKILQLMINKKASQDGP
jgi:CheY-like chemotaxis protein